MTIPRYAKVALGAASLLIAGLTIAGLGVWSGKASRRVHHAASETEKLDAETRAPRAHVRSAAELRAWLERIHPGLDISEQIEEAIDVTTLPLPERKERLERAIAAHLLEPWDSAWGSAAEDRLTAEFAMLAEESPLEAAKVECRTSSCLVTVSWKSHELGPAAYETLMSTPLGLGCRLEMLPPDDGAREGRGYLDCARARKAAEGAVPMTASVTGAIPMPPDGHSEQVSARD